MSDRRVTPFSGRVAHISLRGLVEAESFAEGDPMQIAGPRAGLYRSPTGPLERELLLGQGFLALDATSSEGWTYGIAARDGYCGWVTSEALVPQADTTHRVSVRESVLRQSAELKAAECGTSVYLGSQVCILERIGDWCGIALDAENTGQAQVFYLPACHLVPIRQVEEDIVVVARRFLGTPYVWGGNSGRGIDCSGLVQAAFLACGLACPGDSDLQQAMPGTRLAADTALEAGDLIFWKGHVAIATGADTMIHANAHHMMVVEEAVGPALRRIAASGTGDVTSRLRPAPHAVAAI